jgi:hypothetical protein
MDSNNEGAAAADNAILVINVEIGDVGAGAIAAILPLLPSRKAPRNSREESPVQATKRLAALARVAS